MHILLLTLPFISNCVSLNAVTTVSFRFLCFFLPLLCRWEEQLASMSEAIVKAERYATNMTPEELQKFTLEAMQSGKVQ
jgi:hypothetical protein